MRENSRLLSSSRDYSSSDSRSSSWKLPTSLTSSSRSYDRPWAESSLSSRSKLTDPEGRLGMHSGLLNVSDDGDSKRAKLSYSNRGLYSRTPSASVTGTAYSSSGLSSGRGLSEKQNDSYDSSRSSCRLLARPSSSASSKPLLSRREQETKAEPSLSSLSDRRIRTPGVTSSLYQTDRVTSTYAQGARPKETTYSSSSAARDSSLSRHLSSSSSSSTPHRSSPLVHDFSNRTTTRYGSSALHSSQEQTRRPDASSDGSSSYSSYTPWYTSTPLARPQATLPPRPAPRAERRRVDAPRAASCPDSSSGSSSVRSLDDDSPSTGGESVDSDEGVRMSSLDQEAGGSDPTLGNLRSRRADLAPIQENNSGGYRGGLARPRMASWREPGVGSSSTGTGAAGSTSSWLSSSLRGRCPLYSLASGDTPGRTRVLALLQV
ncbi:hypothetical protein INR49_004189 [Caranx melampygus]|nr:hypothetical protein INR49_004189 [Caranx melampygus]